MSVEILPSQKIKKYDIFAILFLIIMTFQPLVEYFFRENSLIAIITFRLMFALAIFSSLIMYTLGVRPIINKYRIYFLFVFVINLSMTLIYIIFDYTRDYSNIGIYFAMLSGFFFAKVNIEIIRKTLKIIALTGIILLPFIFLWFDFDISVALRRGYTWTFSFFLTGFYWAVLPFIVLAIVYKKDKIVAVLYLLSAIILNLIFIKRAIFVDTAIVFSVYILMLILYTKNSFKKLLQFLLLIAVLMLGLYLLLGDFLIELIHTVFSRFEQTAENITTFDRFVESMNYFKNATFFEILLGKGFLGTHSGQGTISNALHVGWSNFILKGGIFLLSVLVIPISCVPRLLLNYKKLPLKIQFSTLLMIIYFIRLFYVNLHSFLPDLLIFFYCVFNIMDYNATKIKGKKI
ncbi:hypothetical protein [Peloplasma aerotolerans]|uniref:O-antigen ligase family protein n=1 Tax=Peloplasma aerotolerans TaxID=3044389 RepID=A0AAW6U644_9MOLU|nr:hypothetical protein [Mariniplasma sp. M4Ah]MDI6452380.1 hypothetical protein [Mariniplasma sp. M4Ah]